MSRMASQAVLKSVGMHVLDPCHPFRQTGEVTTLATSGKVLGLGGSR